ncbi:uncharacterized protein LOC111934962 [Cyanistes caeruleus]|uniref:uncharacterized protein LOC111934962 n=1 Tax=Cyanistes caeruleus TaxID=156563 RepID=UPI000CDA88D3|nr:uncharacterized protein LOC111934962 [Cyanistes caeruleus]
MPGSGSRGLRKVRSQQPSMEGTAAEAARGSSSPSQVPPSPLQHRGSTDTEVKDRCPICLDSWSEPSFVMPCLHCFCYACILRWANNKTRCPLCKRKMTTILHSVRADDDFEEHAIIPPMITPVVIPAIRAHREPDAPNLHHLGAHQQWETAGDVQHFVGGFPLPNWMSCFSANSAIQQTLYSWFCQSLEMLFETSTSRAQHRHVPEPQHCGEDHHLPPHTQGATGQEDSSSSLTPGPARSSGDEMPSTSSSANGWGPKTQPSASTTIHVEQEPQEEPEKLCPGTPNSIKGSDPSTGGPQRPLKRRASSPKGSPARKRPRH